MKIWHIGASPIAQKVNGLNNVVWLIALEQACMGHQVSLLFPDKRDEASVSLVEQVNLELIEIAKNCWQYNPEKLEKLLNSEPPDIVHMHNVFLLDQATFAYATTPHGELNSQRGRFKKILYNWFVERLRFSAAALTVIALGEKQSVKALIPQYKGIVRWIANPINSNELKDQGHNNNTKSPCVVYLGRFDILRKGIDILIEIARLLPDVDFYPYGNSDDKAQESLEQLNGSLSTNTHFCEPVFRFEKAKVLSEANLYIQTSCWEGFPISVAEAMYLDVPCAIAERLSFAEPFQQHGLGLLLPSSPREAATALSKAMQNSSLLATWSARGKAFSRTFSTIGSGI